MNSNVDIDAWRVLWQARSDGPAAADLRDRVARGTRRRKVALVAPVVITVVIGGWTLTRAAASAQVDDIILAVETWLFIVVAWMGGLWLDRGTWRPLADTTSAFVDLSIRRCRSTLRGLRFSGAMYLWHLLFILFWELRDTSIELTDLMTSWPVILIGWIGGPLLLAFIVIYGRAKKRELQHLLALRSEPWNLEP